MFRSHTSSLILVLVSLAVMTSEATSQPIDFRIFDRDLSIADPLLIVTVDFNHDGDLDLVFSSKATPQVFLLLGNGDGTFGPETSFQTLGPASSLAVADFNNDSNPDLAMAVPSRNSIVVLFGNGNGDFTLPPIELPAGPSPFEAPLGVVAGDFDGDGTQDLMSIAIGSNVVSFVKGHGNRTFGPYTFAGTVRDDPLMIIQADFNGDGILDIATANHDFFGVTVALGTGTGTLRFPFEIATSNSGSLALVAGDFNNDTRLDLAYLHRFPSLPGTFSIIQGNGDGTFGPLKTDRFTGIDPRAIGVEDFDMDGNLDVALALFQSGFIAFVRGTGNISPLGTTHAFLGFNQPIAMAIGDFNNDCRPDVAVLNAGDGTLSILLNRAPKPPLEIVDVELSRSVLWPPNRKLVDVTVNYGTINNCGSATCSLSVTSNEPVEGTGGGDSAPDWVIIDEHQLRLRAERAGNGSGRVYTITITCTDGTGGSATRTVTVTVPKNQRN
jgi:hypothetical protein